MTTELSAKKFRRILANLPDIAWTADQNGAMTYISPKVDTFIGFTSEEIYAAGVAMLLGRVHSEDRERVGNALDVLFRECGRFDEEYRFQHKDGSWVWIQNRATSYRLNGKVLADGVVTDISRRKLSEIELRSKTAFLEAQAKSTIDGILVVDAKGRRILQNERLNIIFKIPTQLQNSSEDLPLLEHVLTLVKNPESFLRTVQNLYGDPTATRQEEIELKDGTILERYSSAVHGSDGEYYGRIWSFRDITERRRKEDTLRQLSAAVVQSPVSVVITDPAGRISYVNPRFTETTGYGLEEVRGKNPRLLNSGYSPPEMYENLWTTIRNGAEWRGEFRNRKKSGEIFWEAATISPIVDQNAKITHFLAVKEDITERRALEGELRQAQKLEAIGQLASGIAHEINTPIQYIGDNVVFLRETWEKVSDILHIAQRLNSEVRNDRTTDQTAAELDACLKVGDLEYLFKEVPAALDQAMDGIARVARIVRAMKEFSHPGSDEKRAVDINKAIEATVTVARNEYKYVADVVLRLDPELPMVVCLAAEINQVLLNLLVNASHAIGEAAAGNGGCRGTIAISTARDGGWAEIRIHDSGIGIPEAVRDRVFDPFFTTKEVGRGTGQGLTLAQNVVVKKHAGRIWFDSEPGHGSTFFVRLPISGLGEGQK